MRIAVWHNLPSGGGKRALHDHVRGLVGRGHEVVAWRPPLVHEDYLPLAGIVEERVVPLDLEIGEGGTHGDHLRRHLRRQIFLRGAMRRHAQEAARQIDAWRPDVLFANTDMLYYAPWVGRYVAAPKALYLGEPNRFLYEAMPRLPWVALPESVRRSWSLGAVKTRARAALDRRAYRLQAADELENATTYDRILVNSNYSRESVLRAYGLPSEVCYLGVDTSRFEARGLEREPFVVSVGAFVPAKDPEFVIRALGTIPAPRPRLVWVANLVDAVHRPRMEALAKELGVDLDLRQYVPDADLLDLLNRAAVMAYAPRLEPFGYAPIEANACGCPAVVVAEGGVKESVRDGINGIVVPHRPEAMGSAISDLLARPEAARAMGVRAAAHVREVWSLDRAVDELERSLLEVAGKG